MQKSLTPTAQSKASAAQAKQTGAVSSLSAEVTRTGQSLDASLKQEMGDRFQHDFGRVRLHVDDSAAAIADGVGARALTYDNHILFGAGHYSPNTEEGRQLIAHELVHVIQQQPVPGPSSHIRSWETASLGQSDGAAEREAKLLSQTESRGETATVKERVSNTIQADWAGAGIGAMVGGGLGALVGGFIGGPIGALIGGGIGLLGGALIGGLLGGGFFPSYSDIIDNGAVRARMDAAWSSTEAAANATTRREEAFWIRLNKATNAYDFGPTILGPLVGPTTGGSAVPGSRPADTNSGAPNAVYTVGLFHTHTPTAFRPVPRVIGPSSADESFHESADVAGIVYDYVESPTGSGSVPAGHPIGSLARLYPSGPNRRQNR